MAQPRAIVRSIVAVALMSAVAVLIPGTPVYLPNFLGRGGQHDGHSTSYWIKALGSADAGKRRAAIFAIGAIGPTAGDAVPELSRVLRDDPDPDARNSAALALSKMAPASRAAVPALADALADPELFVRMNAAIALFGLRGDARAAVPALVQALEDEDNQTNLGTFHHTIQEMVALALGRASAGSSDGLPALLDALSADVTEEMRAALVRALGEVGPEAASAAPRLRVMLRDRNPLIRSAAEDALEKMGVDLQGAEAAQAPSGANELELPDSERKYLWDIEHHGNVLVKHGFGPLADALAKGDAAALSRVLAADFTGADLRDPRRVESRLGHAGVERLEDSGRGSLVLTREAFVGRLLDFRKVFSGALPKVKLALMTLSPKVRGRLDGLWEGTAQLRLHGESAKDAPAEVMVQLRFETARPTEEALAKPGWLRSAGVQQIHTAKSLHYLFAEVTQQRGLNAAKLHDNWTAANLEITTGGVYVCDFDRDGILDVLITDVTAVTLYRGRPNGVFEDVTQRVGLPRQALGSTVAAWIDIDGDGWDDLVLGGRVYRNEGGQRFSDYTTRTNLRLPAGAGGIIVADYDRDGRLDFYVTRSARPGGQSWLDGKSGDPKANSLFRNLGNWQFADVTKSAHASGGRRSTFTAAWLDANNDGWPDLHVINEFGDGVLLINNHDGTFTERRLANRPADFGTMGLAVGDINNDGNIDIYCANMYSKAGTRVIGNLAPDAFPPRVLETMHRFVAGSQLHLNKGDLAFDQVGKSMHVAAVGWAYGACLADLDGDGWLDVYATAGYYSRNRDEPDG